MRRRLTCALSAFVLLLAVVPGVSADQPTWVVTLNPVLSWTEARNSPMFSAGAEASAVILLLLIVHGEAPYSTASQTAWALLGLMAAGQVEHPAVARGVAYLINSQGGDGNWDEPWYTAVGFPRVFYLRYHGYRAFFPLWALARYRRLTTGNFRQVPFGI